MLPRPDEITGMETTWFASRIELIVGKVAMGPTHNGPT